MPHIILEHTSNLDAIPWDEALAALHHAAAEMPELPLAGLRSRVVRYAMYVVGDGLPPRAFVHVTLRLGSGRPEDVRSRIGQHLFDKLWAFVEPRAGSHEISVTLEIQELHPVHNYRNRTTAS